MSDIRDGHYRLGIAYLNAEAYAEAITHFQAVLREDSTFIDAYHGLALAYFGEHRLQDARNAAREALKIDANYLPVLSFLQTIEPRVSPPAGLSVAPAVQIGAKENEHPPADKPRVQACIGGLSSACWRPLTQRKKPNRLRMIPRLTLTKRWNADVFFLGNKQYPQAATAFKKVLKGVARECPCALPSRTDLHGNGCPH